VDVKAFGSEGNTRGDFVAVQPVGQTSEGFGTVVQGDRPFIDELGIEAVHEEAGTFFFDGGDDGAVFEAVLHAEYEPLHPGQEAWDVLTDPEQNVICVVAYAAAVPVVCRFDMFLLGS
jgi:hypothetical protein